MPCSPDATVVKHSIPHGGQPIRKCNVISTCLVDSCYPKGCAAPGFVPCQCNTRGPLSKLERTPPQRKINVTSKSPVGDISVVTLIRTDTTLDHSQKAEKVCIHMGSSAHAFFVLVCNVVF